ncbi:MAG: ABC transporter substrate-binding protein [Firmicutes bacterium]|nr:ABC transporter substrate-binding protein [Bacillota bacterium]
MVHFCKKKGMLALALVLSLVLFLPLLTGCRKTRTTTGNVVNIYNWGEYIDPSLVKQFEEETGIKVVYSTFATNEDLFVKIQSGGANYDLICPSDYMLDKMKKAGLLEKIDYDKIPNMEYIDKKFLHQAYDPTQEYSVPYFWGTVGIVYNKTMVHEEVDSWDILWKEDYRRNILMMDSTRDSFAIGLIRRGYSLNSEKEEELAEAQQDLIAQRPLVYAYLVDQIKDVMINDECALAVMFSGDAVEALERNENLAYVIPKEGTNIWFDAWAIPKGAANKENAEAFINFMSRPDIMAINAEYIGYSLPSTAGKEALPEEVREDPVAYPDLSRVDRLEAFKDMGDFTQVYNELWQDVKNQ